MRPNLANQVLLFRHTYRGKNWYILQDPATGRRHRFSRTAYVLIGLLNGQRTVEQIWNRAAEILGDTVPTQDETIHLLGRLHAAGVLQSDIPPDTRELFVSQPHARPNWKQRLKNPFALRFPLVDPDRFLRRWHFLVRPLFSRAGIMLWLLVVGSAAVLTVIHWPELTMDFADRVLQPDNLLLLGLVYPTIKLLHELGHGFATRHWGGEVHEMGIMLLGVAPVPYVEASASAAFPEKSRRMGVAAAGMAVELFVASLAFFIWLNVEQGQVSTIAYMVMLTGSVSTLLVNGNPLLRFDGYYLLADWLEIPNLSRRSTRYLGYLFRRYLLSIREAVSPVSAPGEAGWLFCYGICAFFYRLFILAALALFVSSRFPVVGVLVACWALVVLLVIPTVRHSHALITSVAAGPRRLRIISTLLGMGLLTTLLLFGIPLPFKTQAEGVVMLPERSRIRAGTDCFITKVLVPDGSFVKQADPLIHCEDPYLEAESNVLKAELAGMEAKYDAIPIQLRAKRDILKKETASAAAELVRIQERLADLTIRSPNSGRLILPEADNLQGRYLQQGDHLGYVMGEVKPNVIVVISQDTIGLVRQATSAVELRLAGQINSPFFTRINREVPAASEVLPSPILGTSGGGKIPVDPRDPKGVRTMRKTFQFEIGIPVPQDRVHIGERVYALFDHGYAPLAVQWYRLLRQLFLRKFQV